jgi:hypothetical protein
MLIAARLVQGPGAAMMTPAALSILTAAFCGDKDRIKAIGAWSGTIPLASVLGVLLGGQRSTLRTGFGATRTIAGLAAATALLTALAVSEQRRRSPLVPFSVFRIKGLAAAGLTQMIAPGRVLLDVLLRHLVHAKRPRLLAHRRRGLLAVPDPRARLLPDRHPVVVPGILGQDQPQMPFAGGLRGGIFIVWMPALTRNRNSTSPGLDADTMYGQLLRRMGDAGLGPRPPVHVMSTK